jgi:hypothetical protein
MSGNLLLDEPLDSTAKAALISALMEIGRERQRILESMRAALLRGDEDEALERARELTGLPAKRPNLPEEDEEETESMNAALGGS